MLPLNFEVPGIHERSSSLGQGAPVIAKVYRYSQYPHRLSNDLLCAERGPITLHEHNHNPHSFLGFPSLFFVNSPSLLQPPPSPLFVDFLISSPDSFILFPPPHYHYRKCLHFT